MSSSLSIDTSNTFESNPDIDPDPPALKTIPIGIVFSNFLNIIPNSISIKRETEILENYLFILPMFCQRQSKSCWNILINQGQTHSRNVSKTNLIENKTFFRIKTMLEQENGILFPIILVSNERLYFLYTIRINLQLTNLSILKYKLCFGIL